MDRLLYYPLNNGNDVHDRLRHRLDMAGTTNTSRVGGDNVFTLRSADFGRYVSIRVACSIETELRRLERARRESNQGRTGGRMSWEGIAALIAGVAAIFTAVKQHNRESREVTLSEQGVNLGTNTAILEGADLITDLSKKAVELARQTYEERIVELESRLERAMTRLEIANSRIAELETEVAHLKR